MPTVIELSYWNIHCYTLLYVAFIIFWFLLVLRYLNRNDDTSFLSFLTTSQKKDNTKKQLQLVRDEYEIAKTTDKTAQMYNDLASSISVKLQFPQIKAKLRAFQDKYNYLLK